MANGYKPGAGLDELITPKTSPTLKAPKTPKPKTPKTPKPKG